MSRIKLFILTLFFSVLSVQAFCQTKTKEITLVNPQASIQKYHTIDELNTKSKGELITLYKERFKVLTFLLPYSALSTRAGVSLKELGIPESSENKTLLEKENKTGEAFDEAVNQSLDNFIAYADKTSIVWSILFFEDTIRKLAIGKDY
ncbi:MAG TPA: hypothetical protein VNB90_14965 [Cytophagaceae bacterium]|nr:hypothetical protein [Cytophagaceae bacterium]